MTKSQSQNPTAKQSHRSPKQEKQAFIEHVYELRARLFWIVATLLIASSIAFIYKDALVNFILAPLNGEKLVYLTIGGGFSFIFTVCLYFGAVASVPVVIYHLYKFLQPVLSHQSRKMTVSVVLASIALALAGAAFGYYVAIRASIEFLMGFAGGAITSSVTADSYLNFIIMYTAGLAIVFQLPLLLFIFDHIRPFPPGRLLASQRFVITGAVIIAALITPTPDIVNQMIIALPIIVIYELGVGMVFIRRLSRERAKRSSMKTSRKQAKSSGESLVLPDSVIESLMVSEPEPVPQTVEVIVEKNPEPQEKLQRVHRSTDGFLVRPAPQGVVVPPARQVSRADTIAQRRVSLDGML